jgi:signal transduction histidine kinase
MSATRPQHSGRRRKLELDEALPLIDLGLQRLREVCGELRPSELTDFGLAEALSSLGAAATRASGIPVSATETGASRALDASHQLGLFRVAQQALTNALRHSGAATVRLALEWRADAAVLSVVDDGAGFDLDLPRRPNQQGLHGMRERMELLGGELEVASQPSSGTTVWASVPLPPAAAPPP